MKPAVVFTRGEIVGGDGVRRNASAWHMEGTPLCLAYHLFMTLPLLERVEIVHTLNRYGCVVRIHLGWRAWLRLGWTHLRARRIARYIVRNHKAAGTLIAVHLAF